MHLFMLPVQFLDMVLDMPIVVLRQVLRSMVQKTVVFPQLHFIDGRRHSLSFRKGRTSWSRLFSGSLRFRSCRSFFGGRCPCCAGRADSQVPPWRRPRFFFCRQAQLLGILAGMAHKNSYAVTLVLLVTVQLALCRSDLSGGFWNNLLYFLREREPRSRGRFSPWKSGHYFHKQYLAVHTSATEAFGRISGVFLLKFLDISLPDVEQVVEVPNIFSEVIPSRSSVSEPQLAEQLVEVPTDRVYALAVVAVRSLGREAAAALSRRQRRDTARPGRDTNTGRRDDG